MTERPLNDFETRIKEKGWACACVKRKNGVMTHIKLNAPERKRCSRCGVTKAESDAIEAPHD